MRNDSVVTEDKGCQCAQKVDREEMLRVLAKHQEHKGKLIAILEDIQRLYGFLPEAALRIVAEKTEHSIADIYGVATFYQFFRLKPRGKHYVSVCKGTSCHVRGAPGVAEELEKELQIKVGETSPDMKFTLEAVNCLGACALGPVVVVDGKYHPLTKRTAIKGLVAGMEEDVTETASADRRNIPLVVNCPHCNHSLMDSDDKIDGHPSIWVTVSFARKHGWLRFSSLYGSFRFESEHAIAVNTVVHFFCPHCHAELSGALECPTCSAPMVTMLVKGGGTVHICSARGCLTHHLDVV